jgi:hypothetical protein
MFSLSYPNFLLPAVLSRFSFLVVLSGLSYAGVPALAVLPKLLNRRSNFFRNIFIYIFIIYAIFGELRGNERAKMFTSTLGTVFAL